MKILLFFLVYLYVYRNIRFSTSFITSYYNILMLITLLFNFYLIIKKKIKISKKISIQIIFYIIFIGMITLISMIINNQSIFKVSPIRNVILNLILDFNFFVVLSILFKRRNVKNIFLFFNLYVYSVVLDICLSVLRMKIEIVDSILTKLYPPNNIIISSLLRQKIRLMGFGGFFFGAGIINSIALILIVFLLLEKRNTNIEKIVLKFCYIFILLVGLLISRTTVLGFILSIFYYFFTVRKASILKFFSIINILLFFIFTGIIIFYLLNSELKLWIKQFVYIQGKSSLKVLVNMYDIIPKSLKTYIIGDAQWGNVNDGYYMKTDVGYIRLIFFYGLIGLSIQLLWLYNLCLLKNKTLRKLNITFFLLILVLNLKGEVSYIPILFYVFCLDKYYYKIPSKQVNKFMSV